MRPDFSYEKKLWQKGYKFVIGIDEVGRGAFAGLVVAAAAAVRITRETELGKDTSEVSRLRRPKPGLRRAKATSDVAKAEWTPPRWREKVASKLLKQISSLGINDSKKLSAKKREEIVKEIKKYFYFGIGEGTVAEINRLGIVKATEKAMRRAIANIKYQISKIKNKNQKSKISHLKIENWKLGFSKQTPFVLIDTFHVKYVPVVGLAHQKAIPKGDQKCISIAAASILAKVYRDNLMCKLSSQYKKYHWEQNKGYGTKNHREQIARSGITKLHRKKFVEKWV